MAKAKQIRQKKFNRRRARLMIGYFFNSKAYILAAICFFLLAVGCGISAVFFKEQPRWHIGFGGLTIVFLLFVVLIAIRAFSGRINWATLEHVIENDRKRAYMGLFKHLAINNNRKEYIDDPLEIKSATMYPGRTRTLYRYEKKTGKLYYSQTSYTWVLFGENNLFVYNSLVNHINGYVGYEVASEVSYQDIVNVQSSVNRHGNLEFLLMTLTLLDGKELVITLRSTPNRGRVDYVEGDIARPEKQDIYSRRAKDAVGSTDALSEKEAFIIQKIRMNIREHK